MNIPLWAVLVCAPLSLIGTGTVLYWVPGVVGAVLECLSDVDWS